MDEFEVEKSIEFDAAHRVPSREGTPFAPHFHHYRVTVRICGPLIDKPGTPDHGMVIDFADLTALMDERIGQWLSNQTLLWAGDDAPDEDAMYLPFVPTAENLAKWCYDQIASYVDWDQRRLSEVEVAVTGGGDTPRGWDGRVWQRPTPEAEQRISYARYRVWRGFRW